jgi:hypothetical protein
VSNAADAGKLPARDGVRASKVWIEAELAIRFNRRQLEVISHLAGYGSGLAKGIREKVTGGVSERDLTELLDYLAAEVRPILEAVKRAEQAAVAAAEETARP